MIVTPVQAHANVPEPVEVVVRVAANRAERAMSEYDEEVVDEERNWSDFDTIEYDDFGLPWI
jgi:hypothetical protein